MLVETLSDELIGVESTYETERNKPMPSLNHSIIQGNISFLLMLSYRTEYRITPEISLHLNGWNCVPDVAIFPLLTVDFRHDVIKFETVPLGVVEILSPTQNVEDLTTKAEMYFMKGVKSYWLILPTLENIYVFEDAYNYQIFTKKQLLQDKNLNIELNLEEIFKA
jgi:Uma2 family endonuclease